MTTWGDLEQAEPEFARRVRTSFDAHRHKTMATLRADGSPRISGIETSFADGELTFGSMANARKGTDLHRDPRFALHSATIDPVDGAEAQWPGEAKISGRAIAAGPIADGPAGTSSTPTSAKSCSPTSTTRPHSSSSNGGRRPPGGAESSGSKPPYAVVAQPATLATSATIAISSWPNVDAVSAGSTPGSNGKVMVITLPPPGRGTARR
jgi:hypothetical protein